MEPGHVEACARRAVAESPVTADGNAALPPAPGWCNPEYRDSLLDAREALGEATAGCRHML